jgi:hypothetical protein
MGVVTALVSSIEQTRHYHKTASWGGFVMQRARSYPTLIFTSSKALNLRT